MSAKRIKKAFLFLVAVSVLVAAVAFAPVRASGPDATSPSPEGGKPEVAAAQPARVPVDNERYLSGIRPLLRRYNQIVLELLANDVALEKALAKSHPTLSQVEGLQQDLRMDTVPLELTATHAQLIKALEPVRRFIAAGGVANGGFGGAVTVAQGMHVAYLAYQKSVVAYLHEGGIVISKAPFFYQEVPDSELEARGLKPAAGKQAKSNIRVDFSSLEHGQAGDGGKISTSESYGLVDGTDGSGSLSGMVNGLAGTGTNGLVDGLGFSSGLNGLVNGTGASSGMSGMFNDTESGADGK